MNPKVIGECPRIAIVGRPNVGKSSLFNCLLGRRAAIVDSQPGVTRDRLNGTVYWNERPRILVDTGGLEISGTARKASTIVQAIRSQVEAALAEASMALLVVDAQSGLTGMDAAIADDLRRLSVPTLVVVNKSDNEAMELAAAEFSRLGFRWVTVSAAHSRGMEDVRETIDAILKGVIKEPGETGDRPKARRLAVVGRPNVGKSSLINAFLKEERVLVSDVPGTTRDAVEVALVIRGSHEPQSFLMIDTAGLRRPRELESAVEAFSISQAEKAVRQCDIAVLVIEAGRAPTAQDKKIAALIRDQRRAAIILANKTDLVSVDDLTTARKEVERCLPFMAHCPVRFVSARTGRDLKAALALIARLSERIDLKLGTGKINRVIERALKRVQPPLVRGVRAKIYYATQTGSNPLRITLFVNDPTRMTTAYRTFMEHEFRRAFTELEGLPIVFDLRGRADKDAG